MRLEVGLAGADESLVRSLQDWIEQERIEGTRVEPIAEPPGPGRLGFDTASALSVALGGPAAVVALIRCLHAWVIHRRPAARIKLKAGKIALEVEAENMPQLELLLDHVAPLLQAAAEPR
jgi:hypothetical protein